MIKSHKKSHSYRHTYTLCILSVFLKSKTSPFKQEARKEIMDTMAANKTDTCMMASLHESMMGDQQIMDMRGNMKGEKADMNKMEGKNKK